jgi:Carboxypeptidase regulatory-like domain
LKAAILRLTEHHTVRAPLLVFALLAGAVAVPDSAPLFSQEPAQSPPQQTAPSSEPSSKQDSRPSAGRHSNDFLVRGTVFTQEGLALPGAELHIRRTAEKKFRWETMTNSRGDFAVRVKMGADYEVVVRAKGYQEQSLSVDAKSGDRFKDLVFRMQHQGGKKS